MPQTRIIEVTLKMTAVITQTVVVAVTQADDECQLDEDKLLQAASARCDDSSGIQIQERDNMELESFTVYD